MNLFKKTPEPVRLPVTLEEQLTWLGEHGDARVSKLTAGRYSYFEARTRVHGVEVVIRSDFFPTPREAVNQVFSRLQETMKL